MIDFCEHAQGASRFIAQKLCAVQRRAIEKHFMLPWRRVSTPMDSDPKRIPINHFEFTMESRITGIVPQPYCFVEVHVEEMLPKYFICMEPMKTKPYWRMNLLNDRRTILVRKHPIIKHCSRPTIRHSLWSNWNNVNCLRYLLQTQTIA